jgi:hypothetical protein
VGFEPTIAVLERAKTVRALDRPATAIGYPMKRINFFNLSNPSGRTTAWGLLSLKQKYVSETEK